MIKTIVLFILIIPISIFAQKKYLDINVASVKNRVVVEDPSGYLKSFSTPSSFEFGVNYRRDFKKNFLLSLETRMRDYWSGYKFEHRWGGLTLLGVYDQEFWIASIDCGIGYRFKTIDDNSILDIGVTFNNGFVTFPTKGLLSKTSFISDSGQENPELINEYYSENYLDNRWAPSLGVSVSRNFKIGKNFYIPFSMNYRLGLRKVFRQEFRYSKYELNEVIEGNSYINSTGYSFEIGIGYTFNKKAEH